LILTGSPAISACSSPRAEENDRYAMAHVAEVTQADVRPSAEIRF